MHCKKNSQNAILIDAGEDTDKILEVLHKRNLQLKYLVNTHGHADHDADADGNAVATQIASTSLIPTLYMPMAAR